MTEKVKVFSEQLTSPNPNDNYLNRNAFAN